MKKFVSILAAFILLFTLSATYAFADGSPVGSKTYRITIDMGTEDGEPEFSYVQEGDKVVLKSSVTGVGKNYVFVRWNIEGDYEIVSGSLTSPDLVIIPKSDVTITQILKPVEDGKDSPIKEEPDDKKPQGEKNDSDTSPETSSSILVLLGGMFLASLLVASKAKKLAK